MKYALIVIEDVEAQPSNLERESMRQTLEGAAGIAVNTESLSMLNQGTFLLALEGGLHPLARLVDLAVQRGIRIRTLFFDQEPSWIVS